MGGFKSILVSEKAKKINEIKSQDIFFSQFELLNLQNNADEMVFNEYLFHPIVNLENKEIGVLTTNKDLKKDLSRLNIRTPLKVLSKYASDNNHIFVIDTNNYFEIVNQTSVIDKEYDSNEAQEFFIDLLTDASRKNASDIHVSWLADSVAIKYRTDGKMVLQPKKVSKELGNALRNIFVNKSGESEYEKNEVSGQLTEMIDGQKKEYRLSIAPTIHGFSIVIRLESHINHDTNLVKWGYAPKAIEIIRRLFQAHNGIILVTGATGSGKSTLLYTCIIEKMYEDPTYKPEILTVEDPVEIIVDGINQVQVNTKGDQENWITFTRAIKMFLRQDPDMIVVGEIRDKDVAMQAVTAAKTGHLTASTLHTNDVKSTFSRLRELGIDNSNIEDGVKGIIAQKLVNKLCNSCKIAYEKHGVTQYKRNKNGCKDCSSSSVKGCKGRVPIVEIAELNNNPENFLPENYEDYYSVEENIIYLIEEGIIDEEEAQRYIYVNSDDSLARRKELLNIWNNASKGISEDIFSVFQPIIDDKDYIIGLESFMRIKDEYGNIIKPNLFLNLIKKMNMYSKFSMFILDKLINVAKKFEKKIFWNIDKDNILDENFAKSVLSKLEKANLLNRFVLEFEFDEKYIDFIKFCNKSGIQIAIDHFEGDMRDLIFIERNNLVINYIKTSKDFVDGIHKKETWLQNYLNLLTSHETEVIVNFIETDAMLKAVKELFKNQVFGYQGWGIRRPDLIENYIDS